MSNSSLSNSRLSRPIIGWDIGGAHLKAVLLSNNGEIIQILQLSCQLWKGLEQLENAMKDALQTFEISQTSAKHAVTMTGELVDLFANRHEGVIEISTLTAKLLGKETMFYAANAGFVAYADVKRFVSDIASTNWHASASALAMHVQEALLIDIGSTTTDIIAIEAGKVKSATLSDAGRMADDSLVYTGVVRTPIMALAQKLTFEGIQMNVAAEYFSTMADVYRLTGELLPESDMAETADGKGKTQLDSARRLARMVAHDVEAKPMETWVNLANTCKTLQINQLQVAVLKHLKPNMRIIGAGAGSFLVEQIAAELTLAYQPPITTMLLAEPISTSKKHDLERCFSAYAVALLAKKQLTIMNQYA